MKNFGKIGLWLLGAAAIYVGGRWLYKRSKATYAELEHREKENKRILKNSGRTEEELENSESIDESEEDKIDYDIDLSKRLFHDCRFLSAGLPLEVIDTNKILDEYTHHVVHVTQSFDRRSKRNVLNFLFEIPVSALSRDTGERKYSDGNTSIVDFSRAIRGKWDHEKSIVAEEGFQKIMEDIVKDPENLGLVIKRGDFTYCNGRIEPYAFISYKEKEDDEWIEKTNLTKLDKDVVENNPFNPSHVLASEYVYDICQYYKEEDVENVKIQSTNPAFKDIEILDAFMAVRVSFYIQDKFHMDGINAKSGLKIIEEIYNKLEINGFRGGVFVYDRFLFYKEEGCDDISVYYEEDREVKYKALYEE